MMIKVCYVYQNHGRKRYFFMEGTEGRMPGMAGGSYGENRNVKI